MSLNNIEIKLSDDVLWDFVCKTLYHKEDVLGLLNDEKDIETDEEEKEEIQEVIDDVTKSECELFSFEKYNYSFHCYEVPYLYSFISDAGFSKALEEIEDDILDFVLWKFFESKNCSDLQKKCGFEVIEGYLQKKCGFEVIEGYTEDIFSALDKRSDLTVDRNVLEGQLDEQSYYYMVIFGDDYMIYDLECSFIGRDYNSARCDILDQFVTQEQFDEVAKDFRLRGF